jgi:hypothetical protein
MFTPKGEGIDNFKINKNRYLSDVSYVFDTLDVDIAYGRQNILK